MAEKKKRRRRKKKLEFSKILLIQESLLVWVTTICFLVLAFMSISKDFFGELSWLGAMCTSLWAAYGATQAFYLHKSKSENSKNGIVFESAMKELEYKYHITTNDPDALG